MEKTSIIQWLIANWAGLIAVLFAFGFMIFVHELGHFIAAKRAGITVHEFALGFGPRIIRFGGSKKGKDENDKSDPDKKEPVETEYCLRIIPFGGFVSMEGEEELGDISDPGNFNNKTVLQRLTVVLAGCGMNYIAGILLVIFIGFVWGLPTPESQNPPAIVGQFMEGYPLEKSGMQLGDKITKVNGRQIKDFNHLSSIISPMKKGETVALTIERENKEYNYKVNVFYNKDLDKGMLGFGPKIGFLNFKFEKTNNPGEVISSSFYMAYNLTIMPVKIIDMLVSRKISAKTLATGTAGPIGIGQMLFEVSKRGWASLLYICAMLSILIGAFNILPIPALDGARAFFLIIEGIRKKPLNPEKEMKLHQIGFTVLMALVFLITINDILRIVKGENIFK